MEIVFKINENQKLNAMVVDNFYDEPLKVREFALSQNIDIEGNYPGTRTIPFANTELKNNLQKIIEPYGIICDMCLHGSINKCIDECNNGSFFLNTINSCIPWIHHDRDNYSAIIYLTPNASLSSGTSILLLKDKTIKNTICSDRTKWVEIDNIKNKFNRLFIFDCKQQHVPNNYFGIDKNDGRLTQVTWFNISQLSKLQNNVINSLYSCKLYPNYSCSFSIIDDFYQDPYKVREFALSQKFHINGDFLGSRTDCFITNDIIKKIEHYLSQYDINIAKIRSPQYGSGSFQYITSKNKPEVYIDNNSDWSGIIFLTPDANDQAGIRFYDYHDKTANIETMKKYSKDFTKWNETDKIYHKFNRLILFKSNKWHSMVQHFGLDQNDSGLFHIFLYKLYISINNISIFI